MADELKNSTEVSGRELAVVPASAARMENAPAPIISGPVVAGKMPDRQLSELPKDELANLAEDLGLDPTQYRTQQHLVAAVHERRQLIAALDREAMMDVVKWGRRPVAVNADKTQIALEIARIRSMKFSGLSHRGLLALARLRGLTISEADTVPELVKKLKKQEGFFSKLNRKRRSMLGGFVASIVGESQSAEAYKYLPPAGGEGPAASSGGKSATIKEEIEESGLFGGISNRVKKIADQYLNQKLDEIEARIDRKLDDIDRRLAEWRDREIANRIRILKITLWASVIVGIFSLIYAYVQQYWVPPH
jgi:hypothetical protein